jgi:hypothetical protein
VARRLRSQRPSAMTTASIVAAAMVRKPLAIHWAAPTASPPLDGSLWVRMNPAATPNTT